MAQRKAKQMTRKYFGTDGIRGQANSFPMTPEVAMKVGMAVGHIFRRKGQASRVVIGKDRYALPLVARRYRRHDLCIA